MFKPLMGAILGALLLSGSLFRPIQAQTQPQARDLELLEVYELIATMISRQNPLFLFPGLEASNVTVRGDGGEYHVVLNGLGLPGSAVSIPEPVTLRLPRQVPESDLITVTMEGLPPSTIMPGGQSLKLINPQFSGLWSIQRQGFDTFDLSLDRVRFQGAGIAYTAKKLSSSLRKQRGQHVLAFSIGSFDADYGDSFSGSERAKGLMVEMSLPTTETSGQILLALAYRLSGLLFQETEIQQKLAPAPPPVSTLNGLKITVGFEGESWDQTVPPSMGTLGETTLVVSVDPDTETGQSRLSVEASVQSINQTLDQMEIEVKQPSAISVELAGLSSEVLADLLLDRREGFDAPALGREVSLVADVSVGEMRGAMPQIELAFSAKRATGNLSSTPLGDGQQTFEITGSVERLDVVDWLNKDDLEPFASTLLTPALPSEASLTLGLEGLKSDDVQRLLTSILSLELSGIAGALPQDPAMLEIVLRDSFYRSRLLEAEWSGRLRLRQGRIPLQGTFEMVTGPLAPLQIGMQQSIGTPVPAISQAMSAGILGLTLLQTFAIREEGGRLRFEMAFPETGGLPLVNGRPLPFQQFLR